MLTKWIIINLKKIKIIHGLQTLFLHNYWTRLSDELLNWNILGTILLLTNEHCILGRL